MTKADLVDRVADAAELTKKDSETVVTTFLESIVDSLHRGDSVELRGFGTFKLRRRKARQGRNPKTGEPVHVPEKIVPYFKPGKDLRELVN